MTAKRTIGMNNLRQAGVALAMYRSDWNSATADDGAWDSAGIQLLVPYCNSNVLFTSQDRQAVPGYYFTLTPEIRQPAVMCNINLMCGQGYTTCTVAAVVRPISDVERPSEVFLLTHGPGIASWDPAHFEQLPTSANGWGAPYGGTGLNVYFVDDHVEWVPFKGSLQSRWWQPRNPPSFNANWCFRAFQMYGP
jgi:hypothetical protein